MRPFLLAAFVLALALPNIAQAADLFVKKPPAGDTPSSPPSSIYKPATPEPAQPAETQSETAPQAAPQAEEESMTSFAARYYRNCMAKQDPILKNEHQQMLCTCSSQKLMDEMTVEDVKTMTEETAEGQFQRNRMLLQVYAPCMEYPARALLINNCMADPQVTQAVPNAETVCNCMGDAMGRYIADNGPAVIAQSLQQDPTNQNPLAALMENPDFKTRAASLLTSCLAAATAQTPAPPAAPAQ